MKDIQIFYDNNWSQASLTFLDLGINIISPIKNKIIPYDDIKKITKSDDVIKITYAKKIDVERKEIVIVVKVNYEIIEELKKRFEILEEAKETIVVESDKEENIAVIEETPIHRLFKLLSLVLCVIFIIFGFNINKEQTVLGIYVTGNKYVPFILSFIFGLIFVIMAFRKGKKVTK